MTYCSRPFLNSHHYILFAYSCPTAKSFRNYKSQTYRNFTNAGWWWQRRYIYEICIWNVFEYNSIKQIKEENISKELNISENYISSWSVGGSLQMIRKFLYFVYHFPPTKQINLFYITKQSNSCIVLLSIRGNLTGFMSNDVPKSY